MKRSAPIKFILSIVIILLIVIFSISLINNKKIQNPEEVLLHMNFDDIEQSAFLNESSYNIVYTGGLEKNALKISKNSLYPNISDTCKQCFSVNRDFSACIWVKSNKLSTDTSLILSNADFSKKNAGIYGQRRISKGFTLYRQNNSWAWNIGNGSQHYLYEPVANDQPIADNQWHQLAFTYNSSANEVRLYYDGINKAIIHTGDQEHKDFQSNLALRIGGKENSDLSNSFDGAIDELSVWNKTLSPDFIQGNYEKYKKLVIEPELKTDSLIVVNWNIWHGGTHYTKEKDGFNSIARTIELIENSDADIVLMQETYGAGSKISSSLGFYYYEAGSCIGAVWGSNISVMSRYPLEEAYMVEKKSNYGSNYSFNNGGVKIRLSNDKKVIAFSNWYNSGKPEDLDGALNAWNDLIVNTDNIPIIFGGDFNSVSHLDDGKGNSGHSKLMSNANFIDSYRKIYPDATVKPGYSFNTSKARIDYIYYKGNNLRVLETKPIVPNFKGKGILTPNYPSDHLGFIAKFKLN